MWEMCKTKLEREYKIKPSNLLWDRTKKEPRLTDFDLAVLRSSMVGDGRGTGMTSDPLTR